MKFLAKKTDSEIITLGLSYNNSSQRQELSKRIKEEQKGFCAYSEKYLSPTESIDIEHFDPSLKGKDEDNYFNWYICTHWINMHKPKKLNHRFLPILHPSDESSKERIIYFEGIFLTKEPEDIEAQNMIDFLLMNHPKLIEERQKWVENIKDLRILCGSDELFIQFISANKFYLSFITALENSLHISLSHLL